MDYDKERPLWAPWRIDYIRSEKENRCFLCNKKESNNDQDEFLVVLRGETMFTILNRYPYNSGHLMIVPYRHLNDISLLTKEERLELMDMTILMKDILKELMNPDGFNLGFNLGLSAGAGVEDHIHFHIVPRWTGDTNFMPVLGGTRVIPETLEATAKLIRAQLEKRS
jgi:ATP adenylyltransferase